MSSSTKREVSYDPREMDQGQRRKEMDHGQRRSTRIYKQQQGGQAKKHEDRQIKSCISSKSSKMPKIVKSSSSTEEHKLETLHSPSKSRHTGIKSHEDSDNNESKTSFKVSCWGSPDLSSGVENLFKAMDLNDSSKSLIISMNLCSIKNMIQLFNLDLHEIGNLFSRQDLRDSVFQDSIIKVLCLGRCFKLLIKEKF